MQGIAQYTLLRKAWALRGSFCRWQKNNQRSLSLPMIIKNQNLENQNKVEWLNEISGLIWHCG